MIFANWIRIYDQMHDIDFIISRIEIIKRSYNHGQRNPSYGKLYDKNRKAIAHTQDILSGVIYNKVNNKDNKILKNTSNSKILLIVHKIIKNLNNVVSKIAIADILTDADKEMELLNKNDIKDLLDILETGGWRSSNRYNKFIGFKYDFIPRYKSISDKMWRYIEELKKDGYGLVEIELFQLQELVGSFVHSVTNLLARP